MKAEIRLKAGKEQSLLRKHPWVFSGAIASQKGTVESGDTVSVISHQGEVLGYGHYQKGSITVRMIQFGSTPPADSFWNDSLTACFQRRKILGLPSPTTTIFRLVHGEGDGLPGLIVDVYEHTAVIQCHSHGMFAARQVIANAILQAGEGIIKQVFDKSAESLGLHETNTWLIGNAEPIEAIENGIQFEIDVEKGQKTGMFIDQRENRALLKSLSQGKSVLNTFCYTGGFSLYALSGGAKHVVSIDSSARAMEGTSKNIALNGFNDLPHQPITADVMQWIKTNEQQFDIIVLDPPAFAKHIEARHRAVQAYKRLNLQAMASLPKGGILFTFSCSQVVDRTMFRGAVMAAAVESGRNVRILYQLTQPADHPVSIFHPEGEYLKGLVLQVE